jgi:hypothetical protein
MISIYRSWSGASTPAPAADAVVHRALLEGLQRIVGDCLKGDGDAVQVPPARGDPARDNAVKVDVQCRQGATPRPFSRQKEAAGLRFTTIGTIGCFLPLSCGRLERTCLPT